MKTAEETLSKHYDVDNSVDERAIVKAMKEYAIEVAKEALRLASENVTFITYRDGSLSSTIDTDSILSENNLPKLD